MRRHLLLTSILLALLGAPLGAYCQDEPDPEAIARAQEYYKEGEKAFKLGKFEEAIGWFEKAYEETLYPAFLLNIAQCYKQLHRCDKAIFLYKQYKQSEDVDQEGVQRLIDACEEELKNAATQPTTTPVQPEPIPEPPFSLSLIGRGLFAAGSVGNSVFGQNTSGVGFSAGAAAFFRMPKAVAGGKLSAGGGAFIEGRTTGVVPSATDPNSTEEGATHLRGSLGAFAGYDVSPQLKTVVGAGLALGPEGAGAVTSRFSLEALYRVAKPVWLSGSLGYEFGGGNPELDPILGCNDDRSCHYSQLDLSLGVWFNVL